MLPEWMRRYFPNETDETLQQALWMLGMEWGGYYGVETFFQEDVPPEIVEITRGIIQRIKEGG
jgi:hypothetical protein